MGSSSEPFSFSAQKLLTPNARSMFTLRRPGGSCGCGGGGAVGSEFCKQRPPSSRLTAGRPCLRSHKKRQRRRGAKRESGIFERVKYARTIQHSSPLLLILEVIPPAVGERGREEHNGAFSLGSSDERGLFSVRAASACPSSAPSRSKGIQFEMTETNIYYARARA